MRSLIFILILIVSSKAAYAEFDLFLTHRYAEAQPTIAGKKISELTLYDGSIYIGYGDAGANTGPIKICKFTPPDADLICEFILSTEKIFQYKILDNKLYALAEDPSAPSQHAYAVKTKSSNWDTVSRNLMAEGKILPAHIYDMSFYNGKLWVVGSQHVSKGLNSKAFGDSSVWSSSDGGASWQLSLDVKQINDCCSRFYFSAVVGGNLYVQAVDFNQRHPFSKIYNGSDWVDGPNILKFGIGFDTKQFRDTLLMRQNDRLVSFDGINVTEHYKGVEDYTISEGYVYIINAMGVVYRSKNLKSWQFIDELNDVPVNSIEIKNSIIYIGTNTSEIYKSKVLSWLSIMFSMDLEQ